MADKMELVFNLDAGFLHDGPIQLAIDCNQTYEDENGVIRIDLDRLFDDNCEEHEASMVRPDSYFGFNKSREVDDSLLNNLMKINPSSDFLSIEDIMQYQNLRIMERLPSGFVPGALRDTPFNPMDITDFVHNKLERTKNNVESMMHLPMDEIVNFQSHRP